jgi:D-serine deaminase-like pyridoxal phosphate-dependent protein
VQLAPALDAAAIDLELWGSAPELPTPHVAVHRVRLRANLDRVAAIARSQGVALRPHVKTHKCLEIARLQIERGAIGVTASKPQEAIVFIEAGVPSVTVAYPVVAAQAARALLEAAARHGCDLRFVVDSLEGVAALATGVGTRGKACLLLEVDVGLQRCGVRPGSAAIGNIADAIQSSPQLELRGILSHAGHAYAAPGRHEIAAIAADERRQLMQVVDELAERNVAVREVSVGSTPTVLAADSFAGVTEIRPGNYVFLDGTAHRLGIARLDQIALGVVTTVVSSNERYSIIDAGSKVLSSDTGPHGTGAASFGRCFALGASASKDGRHVVRLSEEHGFVEHRGAPWRIGSRALVIPNHACPVVNLADRLVVLEAGCDAVFWAVAARGKTS